MESATPTDRPRARRAAAVSIAGVSRTYGKGAAARRALDDVSVEFAPRSFNAIMGPSGSGKTTLLQCAAGLDAPDAGRVWIAGTEITGLGERRLAKLRRGTIGFVFQSFNLLPSLTAAQNIVLPLRLAGRRPRRRVADEALERVGLAGLGRRRPAELSGGQQQRVAIARALATEPEVIFADEPTGALDRPAARDILELLRELTDRDGRTVVMVTHDPLAAAVADRVLFLADGRIVDDLIAPSAERIADVTLALGER